MRFLALCLIALSFATSSTTAKIIIGSTPPAWPLSFSSDYSSIYSAVPESSIQGSITISNNEKIRVESTGPHHSFQSIIIKEQGEGDKKNDADIYCTRKFGDFPSRCRHSKHPFNPFLLNDNNQCLEFQYKGEGIINGIIANGWSTICSIAKKDLFHHPMRGNEEERGGEMIQFAMTYYYQDSIPYAIVSSPLSGPGVNTNATIIYSNFQSINPDASLFTPPTNCEEKGEERKHWGHKGFGGGNDGGLYRDESHPRHRDHHSRSTPDNFIELPKKGEGIHRSLKDRRIRFTDQHEEINGKKGDEMMHDQPDRHMIRRHDMEEMPPKRGEGHMGEIGGPIIGGDGMDGHHGLIGGGDHDNHGESHKDFRGKRLAVHVTKMALKLIHFVNTKYLQKQG